MTKLGIKQILKEWHFYISSEDLSVLDILMPIQTSITILVDTGQLDDKDISIIDAFSSGYNYSEISRLFKISRQTVASRIDRIAVLISAEIGDLL